MPKRKPSSDVGGAKSVSSSSASFKSGSGSGSSGGCPVTIPPGMRIVWQLEDETKNSWHEYGEDIQDALRTAAVTGRRQVKLSAGPRSVLTVDVGSLLQINNKGIGKRLRGLLEVGEDLFSWEVQEDDTWQPLPVAVAVKLEQIRDIGSSVTIAGVGYDLDTMCRTSDKAALRREKQMLKKISKTSITSKIKLAKDQSCDGDTDGPQSKKSKSSVIKNDPEEVEEEKPVMKSVIKKGLAPVDSLCPSCDSYTVYCEGRNIWDVMLNQTNIQNNNNKFYLIQLLQHDSSGGFAVWMRWGRVGYDGQTKLSSHGKNVASAQAEFEKKFTDKTKNNWGDRDNFEKVAGKYDLVKIDYNNTEENSAAGDVVDGSIKDEVKEEAVESKLPANVQDLISLICNIKTMEEAVIEMKYDTKKAPLGKITVEQIKAGYVALKKISECVEEGKSSGRELLQACNDFYTRIPHEFGFKTPPLIKTAQEVKKKLELLEALSDIQVALKILSSAQDTSVHPIDRKYEQLKIDIEPMKKKSNEWKMVEKSIKSTHAATHNLYNMEVLDLFSLDKSSETEQFKNLGNSRLLYHGSRLSNWAGILGHGLKIAPPEAPVTGYMFGKGVYFADMSSKSANYCYPTRSQPVGLLLICEVALGEANKLVNADYNADKLPAGTKSVMGMGRVEPSSYEKMKNGLQLPMGPARNTDVNKLAGYTLNYNEFIVYDTKQVKMKYLAKIKFNFK